MQRVRRALALVLRTRHDPVARDTLWAAGLEGLQLGVMLLSFALLGRQLGPAGFGAYASMYAIVGILGGLVYSGPSLALVQSLVRDREALGRVVSSYLGLVLLLGLAAAALGTAVGQVTVPGLSAATVAAFLLAELLGTASIEVLATVVYAHDGVAAAARYRVVPLVTKLLVLVGLAGTGRLTVPALGLAYLLLYPVLAVVLSRRLAARYDVAVRPGRPSLAHLRGSSLYATTISALTLQNDADKLVLGATRSGAETGQYAAAYRLVLMGMVPLRALLAASHRRFLVHDPEARGQHVRRAAAFSGVGLAYGLVFGLCLFVAAPLVPLLLGDGYDAAVPMLRALAPVVAVRSLAEFGLNGLLGFGRVGLRTVATLVAAATALVSYVLLVPDHGWQGAVAGTYASEVALGLVAWSVLLREQRRHDRALDDAAAGPATVATLGP